VRGTDEIRLAEAMVARLFFETASKRRFFAHWRLPRSCKSILGQKKSLS
jgi:hypothetical protein